MTDATVLCVGHGNVDIAIPVEDIPEEDFSADVLQKPVQSVGGAAANTAQAIASFGYDTHFMSTIGDDNEGDIVVNQLKKSGVTPHVVRSGLTTVIRALITQKGDPRYLGFADELEDFSLNDISDEAWGNIDHVHVTSFGSQADDIAEQAAADGKTVSFTPTQGYGNYNYETVVENADVIFMNEREAEIFRDRHFFAGVAETTTMVTTQGSMGASVYAPNGITTHLGFNVDRPELSDTIGAGDAFTAGFLAAWLDGADNEASLARANAAGAYAVTTVGAPNSTNTEFVDNLTNDS